MTKKKLINIASTVLPLLLGVFFIWLFVSDITDEEWTDMKNAFINAHYGWVLFSLVFAMLSHISRAYRWKYTIRPLGHEPRFMNSFFSVMIAYLVNLGIPRSGEVARCGVMSRYDKIPFEKLLGTVIAERFADLIILLSITVLMVSLQLQIVQGLVYDLLDKLMGKFSPTLVIALGGAAVIGLVVFIYLLFSKSVKHPFVVKLRSFASGLLEGLVSIWNMKDKWPFIGHTFFIWFMYLAMFYVCFFALPQTSDVPFAGVLMSFVLGGFTVVLTNGGIGAYPLAVQMVLILYGVDKPIAGAFGWIVWTAQTILLVAVGALSFIIMPIYNKNREKHVNA